MATLWQAYDAWCGLAGPLADFVAPTPFLAPWDPEARQPRHPAAGRLADALVAKAGSDGGIILEAGPRLGLAVAARLLERKCNVAPVFFRWPHPDPVLPARPLSSWLLGIATCGADQPVALRSTAGSTVASPSAPCILLDAERARTTSASTLRRRFDNRFTYGGYQLPPATRWRATGITRLVWAAPAAGVARDLEDYAEALVGAGITLELLSLPSLIAKAVHV